MTRSFICYKNLLVHFGIWLILCSCASSHEALTQNEQNELPALPFTAESFKAFADPEDYERFFQLTPYVGKEENKHFLNRYSIVLKEAQFTVHHKLVDYKISSWYRKKMNII